jgi:hypothetical protein
MVEVAAPYLALSAPARRGQACVRSPPAPSVDPSRAREVAHIAHLRMVNRMVAHRPMSWVGGRIIRHRCPIMP